MESLDSEAMRYDAIISALLVEGRRQRKRGKKEYAQEVSCPLLRHLHLIFLC